MSATPAPLPRFRARGRWNRGFRHQALGYPMTKEWLTKTSMELWGKPDFFRASGRMLTDSKLGRRPIHAVYDRTTKQDMLMISLAENTSPAAMQDPPEEEIEWARNYLGAEGRPLWYDVCD